VQTRPWGEVQWRQLLSIAGIMSSVQLLLVSSCSCDSLWRCQPGFDVQ
jgi:hypothetical protein